MLPAKEARNILRTLRCREHGRAGEFPSWLKDGGTDRIKTNSKSIRSYIYADKYVGAGPADIAGGYKVTVDDPAAPIKLLRVSDTGYFVYLEGKGVIVGKDGTPVLVGYKCPPP